MSLIVAPLFRSRLNEQFLLGARNQAFTTEYVAGLETVKSLQMEPQLNARYSDYLAEYLRSGFNVRQIGNTYNVALQRPGTDDDPAHPDRRRLDRDEQHRLHHRHAGRLPDVRQPRVATHAAAGRAVAAVPAGQPVRAAPGRHHERPDRTLFHPAQPPARRQRPDRHRSTSASAMPTTCPSSTKDFNLKVAPGKVVAIMGPSGSGKSTLTKLLQGFYQPAGGTIKIDGNDIRYLSANELRHYFGVVPQETILFSGTIYDNLLMANPHATFDQVVHACKMAEIHSAIEALPQGYQTEIGERGVGLSGGQKQRIAIARALIKQPKILIFDEATSSLDATTAEHFAATINQLKGKVTMLFITHAMPKNLLVDEMVRIGQGSLSAVATGDMKQEAMPKREAEGGVHG